MVTSFAAVIPFRLASPAWMLGIHTTPAGLCGIDFLAPQASVPPRTALAARVVDQLERYFTDPEWRFDVPLDVTGTVFQQRVWRQLRAIPAGSPVTYGALARVLGSGARAVGNACRRNPLPVVVPCHRVVAQVGPGGFSGTVQGAYMDIKQALLAHESRHVD